MMNEQPLVDVTIMGLVHVTEMEMSQTLADKQADIAGTSARVPSATSSDSSIKNTSSLSLVATTDQQKPIKFLSSDDLMMGHMEEFKVRFKSMGEIEQKEMMEQSAPAIERDVSRISSCPPPTWSMLQEEELIKSCNPVMAPTSQSSKKQSTKVAKKTDFDFEPRPRLSTQITTPDSFKPRPVLTSKGKPFVMAKGTGKEMSVVGMDDTMKSSSEVRLESDYRKMWEVKGLSSYAAGTEQSTSTKKEAKKAIALHDSHK